MQSDRELSIFETQRPELAATPICTTVVQIKRARLEDASRTTLPETLFEHTPFLNLKTPRPTTTPPQHHKGHAARATPPQHHKGHAARATQTKHSRYVPDGSCHRDGS